MINDLEFMLILCEVQGYGENSQLLLEKHPASGQGPHSEGYESILKPRCIFCKVDLYARQIIPGIV